MICIQTTLCMLKQILNILYYQYNGIIYKVPTYGKNIQNHRLLDEQSLNFKDINYAVIVFQKTEMHPRNIIVNHF